MSERELMEPYWAVFNCHTNNARNRARKAFIEKYGRAVYMRRIYPVVRRGIMLIFADRATEHTRFYVDKITEFVNAKR